MAREISQKEWIAELKDRKAKGTLHEVGFSEKDANILIPYLEELEQGGKK